MIAALLDAPLASQLAARLRRLCYVQLVRTCRWV